MPTLFLPRTVAVLTLLLLSAVGPDQAHREPLGPSLPLPQQDAPNLMAPPTDVVLEQVLATDPAGAPDGMRFADARPRLAGTATSVGPVTLPVPGDPWLVDDLPADAIEVAAGQADPGDAPHEDQGPASPPVVTGDRQATTSAQGSTRQQSAPAPARAPARQPPPPPPPPPPPAFTARPDLATTSFSLLNRARADAGLPDLARHASADRIAQGWAEHLAKSGAPAHNPRVGEQMREALGYGTVAENVGYDTGGDAHRIHTAFMNSGQHRANITGDYRTAGVGAAVDADGTLWLVQVFHRPRD